MVPVSDSVGVVVGQVCFLVRWFLWWRRLGFGSSDPCFDEEKDVWRVFCGLGGVREYDNSAVGGEQFHQPGRVNECERCGVGAILCPAVKDQLNAVTGLQSKGDAIITDDTETRCVPLDVLSQSEREGEDCGAELFDFYFAFVC
jgi:hypothetical protein